MRSRGWRDDCRAKITRRYWRQVCYSSTTRNTKRYRKWGRFDIAVFRARYPSWYQSGTSWILGLISTLSSIHFEKSDYATLPSLKRFRSSFLPGRIASIGRRFQSFAVFFSTTLVLVRRSHCASKPPEWHPFPFTGPMNRVTANPIPVKPFTIEKISVKPNNTLWNPVKPSKTQ